jgi:hypothetical protein
MTAQPPHLPRRKFLQNISLLATSFASPMKLHTQLKVGLVPFGKTTIETGVQDFWGHADEVAALEVHHIEFNNTRARIAEAYLPRLSEFRDGMVARRLTMPGLAQYSHMDKPSELGAILSNICCWASSCLALVANTSRT